MYIESTAERDTNRLVIICDALFPIILPKKPEIIEAKSGKKIINFSILSF